MPRRKTREEWLQEAAQVLDQLDAFNTAQPHATWAQIEEAVDGALADWRRDLLAESVAGHALADFRGAAERPCCPHCGTALQANGQQRKGVLTQGDKVVEIERTYGRCPACGAGVFPPGCGTGTAAG
jgi:hypothetical protein